MALLPGLGGGTAGAQLAPGAIPAVQNNPTLANTALNGPPVNTQPQAAPTATQQAAPVPTAPGTAPVLSASGGAILPQGGMAGTPTAESIGAQPPLPKNAQGATISPFTGQPMPTVNQVINTPLPVVPVPTPPSRDAQIADVTKKFNEIYSKVQGLAAADTGSTARQEITKAAENTGKTETDPQTDAQAAYAALPPALKMIYDNNQNVLSTGSTIQQLEQELGSFNEAKTYADSFSSTTLPSGTPGESISQEQLKMMDIKRLMDGTRDDIASEIQHAGGFATNSQVEALTASRNKVLQNQMNALNDSMTLKQDYITHLLSFTQQDRKDVEDQLNQKLGLESQQVQLIQNAENAAKDNYKTIISKNGFAGLYAAMAGNTEGIKSAERLLGLPPGGLKAESDIESIASNDKTQFVSATQYQQGGFANLTAQTFTPIGGGGGGGVGTDSGGTPANGLLSGVVNTLKHSMASPTKAQLANLDAIANDSNPLASIKNQAQNIMGQTAATKLYSTEVAGAGLASLASYLKDFYDKGGSTDIFSGNLEFAVNKLGEVKDPKLVGFATQIETTLQAYRNAISGTAYSNQEGKAISYIFPGINKSEGLNTAILGGRQRALDELVNASYDKVLGDGVYQQLVQQYSGVNKPSGKGTMSDKAFVESSLENAGVSYQKALDAAGPNEIAVVDNQTGELLAVTPEEFSSSKYTRL